MNHQSVTLSDYHAIMSVLLDRFFAMKKIRVCRGYQEAYSRLDGRLRLFS